MIYTYGITQKGRYHKEDHSVCQDAHKIMKRGAFVYLAVADGVGSNTHSHIASQIAVDASIDYCAEHINDKATMQDILNVMKDAFRGAKQNIEERATKGREKEPEEHKHFQYHTTLTLAVYTEGRLYYGQSGDSGILVLNKDGLVELVTKQQRDSMGRVYPLAYGEEHWVFGHYGKEVASILLATDGMLDALMPTCLSREGRNIYVAMACYFMDNAILDIDQEKLEKIVESRDAYMRRVVAEDIYDDLTIAVLVDEKQNIAYQKDDYYDIPKVIKKLAVKGI